MKSEQYIPRDDMSEFLRMQNFAANSGIGLPLFDNQDDPEFSQVMSDLGADEINFAEDGG